VIMRTKRLCRKGLRVTYSIDVREVRIKSRRLVRSGVRQIMARLKAGGNVPNQRGRERPGDS
jgi:hypothetical protein